MDAVLFGSKSRRARDGGKSFKIRVARKSVVIEFTLRVPTTKKLRSRL
jgi:hypothetical protein